MDARLGGSPPLPLGDASHAAPAMKGRVAGHQIIALSEHFKAMPHIEVWIDLSSQFQHLITFAVVDAIGSRPLIIPVVDPRGPRLTDFS